MRTVFFGSSKAYHVLWKDFWDATDSSGDDVKAGTSGFKDGDPERLGERCVHEYFALVKDLGGKISESRLGVDLGDLAYGLNVAVAN